MQGKELAKIRAIVNNGPYTDPDFIRHANAEWDESMMYLESREKLRKEYATRLYRKTKELLEDRKSDFYYQTCNELDVLLQDSEFAKRTATFGAIVREAAFAAFMQIHADVYDFILSFLSEEKLSSPTVS